MQLIPPARLATRVLAVVACSLCVLPAAAPATSSAEVIAFIHVNVVPMDEDRVLPDQTVLVERGRIAAVGHGLAVPKHAQVLDGHGAYLSPGLADMHSHSSTRDDLAVYLANGVTSILNMGGASAGFIDSTRPAANDGEIPGPHVYAAFRIDGSPRYNNFFVTTPDEARAVVGLAKTNGYDFIKVYNDLSAACFQALIDEGRIRHMPVVGHGVTAVGLRRQLAAGQVMVAHAEEFLYTVFYDPDHIPEQGAPDPAQIPGVIDFVLADKAFVTADLDTYATLARQWGKPEVVERFLRLPEARYLRPEDRILWTREDYTARKGSIQARLEFLEHFTKAMSDAGVPLIAGTDAPSVPGLVPGFSLHDDLDVLVDAGLSRYQALATATRTAGAFIHRSLPAETPFGTVTPGSRADLVMTTGNPLDDLATLRHPLGVMAAGRWHDASGLQRLLEDVAKGFEKASAHG